MLLSSRNIFILEDDMRNRVIYQLLMARHGAKVIFDRWGRDTIWEMKKYGKFDLIILDLMLPNNVSGYDIFEEIRKHYEFAHIPIVAVSASEPSDALPRTKAMGFDGFIAKPIDDELFPKQLSQLIRGEKVWYAGERY